MGCPGIWQAAPFAADGTHCPPSASSHGGSRRGGAVTASERVPQKRIRFFIGGSPLPSPSACPADSSPKGSAEAAAAQGAFGPNSGESSPHFTMRTPGVWVYARGFHAASAATWACCSSLSCRERLPPGRGRGDAFRHFPGRTVGIMPHQEVLSASFRFFLFVFPISPAAATPISRLPPIR